MTFTIQCGFVIVFPTDGTRYDYEEAPLAIQVYGAIRIRYLRGILEEVNPTLPKETPRRYRQVFIGVIPSLWFFIKVTVNISIVKIVRRCLIGGRIRFLRDIGLVGGVGHRDRSSGKLELQLRRSLDYVDKVCCMMG
jgi:hypothetical protein